jgi:hypothetical protein
MTLSSDSSSRTFYFILGDSSPPDTNVLSFFDGAGDDDLIYNIQLCTTWTHEITTLSNIISLVNYGPPTSTGYYNGANIEFYAAINETDSIFTQQ